MKRRSFFKAIGGATSTAALLSMPLISQANTQGQDIQFLSEIGNNHGHDLQLNIVQVIELMGQTQDGSVVELDIQGQSGHPHAVTLELEQLIDLLVKRELLLESTSVAGHTHSVAIELAIL